VLRESGFFGTVSDNLIIKVAVHLGISSETLSRILTRFEAEGLIESEGKLIRVLDPAAIQEIADWGPPEA